jgi:hypothetical protein
MNRLLDRLRPATYRAHYPRWMVGKPLLIASSALASLGDAMFGYSQGVIAGIQVQPSFIERMYGIENVTLDQIQNEELDINPFLVGQYFNLLLSRKCLIAYSYRRILLEHHRVGGLLPRRLCL